MVVVVFTVYHVRGSQDVVYKLTLKAALVLSGETLLIQVISAFALLVISWLQAYGYVGIS